MGAAVAAEAAHNQGKFWEYHDKLFANQSKLSPDDLKQYAKDLGLDTAKFEADLASPQTLKRVSADVSEANSLGITGTPAFLVNGHYLSGAQPFDGFAKVINSELQRLKLPVPPPPTPAPAPTK
jgi:protein-disulfide isomerase